MENIPVKNKKLIIVGDSSFAEIAYEYFTYDSPYEVVAFSVEKAFLKQNTLMELPIVPFEALENMYSPNDYSIYVAIPYAELNQLRNRLMTTAKTLGFSLASYISSQAFLWRNVKLGEHCFIFENNTIQPFVTIENNVVLWSGNHIGHHSIIKENCFISSQVVISGHCTIGKNSFLGVNATIANNVEIGAFNWLSPNVTVMKNTDDDSLIKIKADKPCAIATSDFFKVEIS